MNSVVVKFISKSRCTRTDLPLSDIGPLSELTATSGVFWRIYGSHLVSSGVEVSVFVFNKHSIAKFKDRRSIMQSVYRHIETLKNMQKYSSVTLKLVLAPQENRRYIAYATEPVLASLENVIRDCPAEISHSRATFFNRINFCEIEIKHGIMTIAETLSYLHLSERLVHCDVSPRNILICADRLWKLGGFYFTTPLHAALPLKMDPSPTKAAHDYLQPDVNFASLGLYRNSIQPESDVFSLGMVISALYNKGISLLEGTAIVSLLYNRLNASNKQDTLESEYADRITSAFNAISSKIPEGLHIALQRLMSFKPERRPTAQQFLMLEYFEDPAVKCLKQLAVLDQLPEMKREEFFSTLLPDSISRFSQTQLQVHIQPILMSELPSTHWSPGNLRLMIAFIARYQSLSKLTDLCSAINQVINNTDQLPVQSYQLLLTKLPVLIDKSAAVNLLCDPLQIVRAGLDDDNRIVMVLNAIQTLASGKLQSNITVQNQLLTLLQQCVDRLVSQLKIELCSLVISSLPMWMSALSNKEFTQTVINWLMKLLYYRSTGLEFTISDIWNHIICAADIVKLDKYFIKTIMSQLESTILLPSLTVQKKQTLMHLLWKLETFHHSTNEGISAACATCNINSDTSQDYTTMSRSSPITNSRDHRTNIGVSPSPISIVISADDPIVADALSTSDDLSRTSDGGITPVSSRSSPILHRSQSSSHSWLDVVDEGEQVLRRCSFSEIMSESDERYDRLWSQLSPLQQSIEARKAAAAAEAVVSSSSDIYQENPVTVHSQVSTKSSYEHYTNSSTKQISKFKTVRNPNIISSKSISHENSRNGSSEYGSNGSVNSSADFVSSIANGDTDLANSADSVMRTLLTRLDSLTNHFSSGNTAASPARSTNNTVQ